VLPVRPSVSTLVRIAARLSACSSTKSANVAPREMASMPSAPEPAKRSSTRAPSRSNPSKSAWARILNSASRVRLPVGRTTSPSGASMMRPLRVPPTIRMRFSFVFWFRLFKTGGALSGLCACLGAERQLSLGPRCAALRLFLAGAGRLLSDCLFCRGPARIAFRPCVGRPCRPGCARFRMLVAGARRCSACFFSCVLPRFLPRILARFRSFEAGGMCAELVHQHTFRHGFRFARLHVADLEGAEGEPDQAVDLEAQRTEHALHFAILAFLEAKREPHIRTLHLVECRLDGAVAHALNRDAAFELVEIGLCDRAESAHAVAACPSR